MNLAEGLGLDADYIAGRSIGLLGKRGAGKSATCRVIAEELHDAHVQTVMIDPMGVFWGLRSSADGIHDGLPIPVFGGSHADAPLEASAGALMAELAVEEGLSMVLDLSEFATRAQERTFVAAFLDRLYRRNRHLLHLVVDEADLFAPQKPRRDDLQLLVAMENIVRRGRNTGLGTTLASQRPAVLHKDVLSQVDILAAMRVTSPNDRAAIQDWIRGQGDDQIWATVAATLPTLAVGEAWWWAPERDILTRAQVRQARTFDCSPTRDRGNSAAREPKTRADVDLGQIAARIAATRERAAATDPKALTARIRELEKEVHQLRTVKPTTRVIEVPAPHIPESAVAAIGELHNMIGSIRTDLERVARTADELATIVAQTPEAAASTSPTVPATAESKPTAPLDTAPRNPPPVDATQAATNGRISATQTIVNGLAELASFGIDAPNRAQLALWVGVGIRSSGFANNLGKLRTAGLIDYPSGGRVALTDAGQNSAAHPTITPTTEELHRRINEAVRESKWRILKALIDAYPSALSRTELAERAGISPSSSGYANNLGALRTLGLLGYPHKGHVAATDVLFLHGR
ncbi:ATP-binding protein [Mycolicibacterium llatzerense]|uniref:ATP-binding protein n=1 Tax=Mycolicibacterium llatzerense TaxID=280871 RepID=UPI0008DDB931|nr:AAA family ATPase [Mycolicibacterium llatzerense]